MAETEDKYIVNLTPGPMNFQDLHKGIQFTLEPYGTEGDKDRVLVEDDAIVKNRGVQGAKKKGLLAIMTEAELASLTSDSAVVRDVEDDTLKDLVIETDFNLIDIECVGRTPIGGDCTRKVSMTGKQLRETPPLCPVCRAQASDFKYENDVWVGPDGNIVELKSVESEVQMENIDFGLVEEE